MSFGFSVGDIILAVQIVAKVGLALRETGGASSEFQEASQFLCGLELTLQHLQGFSSADINPTHGAIIQAQVELIRPPLSEFLDSIEKFETSLGPRAADRIFSGVPRKLHWSLFVSKKAKKLQDSVAVPLCTISLLLQYATLYVPLPASFHGLSY